ncbi:hypothetical protein [Brucella sp. IR073]|uniref:hypothetical protein n=1 Tax=unclassified Brucella TaxID=2632610 RepID=UPI003B98281C
MSSKIPPVPEENRSDKGPGEPGKVELEERQPAKAANPDKQGQQANTKINATHQGLRQAR